MAALSVTNPNLVDLAKAMAPDGSIDTVIEILNQTNEMLADMSWMPGNLPTGHRTTLRTGLPTPTWRRFNGGVQPNKGTTRQVTFNCGMLEAFAEVDKALADLNGNTMEYRFIEDRAHIEGMNQEVQQTLIFGNEGTEPEAFTGLAQYYNDTTAASGENMISGGGANGQTDCTSIYLVCWSPLTVHGLVPKGSKAGLQTADLGECVIENSDGSGGRMRAYRTHYRWDVGLAVRDWRYGVRIHSIDKSTLTKDAATGPDLPDLMHQALEQIPNLELGRCAFYMSRSTRSFVRRQAVNLTKNSTLAVENVGGKMLMTFQGIPLRRVDALAANENSLN